MKECVFCNLGKVRIITENRYCICIPDKYPVTVGHSLVIPKRHFSNFFEIKKEEYQDVKELLEKRRKNLLIKDKNIDGFNIGVNIGHSAGQTVDHCHIHLIPRRTGDIKDPTGGVRGVIPAKRIYSLESGKK